MSLPLPIRSLVSILVWGSVVSSAIATTPQPTSRTLMNPTSQAQTVALEPIKDPFLIKVRQTGGRCRAGQCWSELTVLQDGSYRYSDAEKTASGRFDRRTFARLERRVARLNLEQVKSQPFTGPCPTAYDALETRYLFLIGHQVEEISECQYAIDPTHPLFRQARRLYEQVVERAYQAE